LLEGVAEDPQARIGDLPLLSASEHHQVIERWNETAVDYPAEKCVHELFEEQVNRTPDAVAVAFEDRQLTYAELNKKANRLAHYLQTSGVEPEARVGICLERSLEMVIGMLGILKAGGAYVPLDAAFPAERKALMMTDSEVKIVLSTSAMELPEIPLVARINLDQTTALAEGVADGPGIALGGEAPAYLMYTSGSTGKPKGIMTPHRAIGRTVLNCGYADFNESDRVAFAANPAFDAATMEIWAPLLNGGRIVVVDREAFLEPRRFAQLVERQGVTALFLTTAIFDQYAQAIPEALARLRYLFCGGEKNDPTSFSRVLEQSGPRHLVHCYGPTETTTFAITHEVTEVSAGKSIPLGRPISNTRIYILDANLQPTPIGVTGELYIGGAGVALGYLNRPELTAERFLNDPFTEQTGARMYKTGDLGCWLADGTIEFLGRSDFQVKIRGFRIELGEIEARLEEHAGVGQAVVVMREDTAGDKRLVAYYTCVEETERVVVAEDLRSHLSARLPEYMVPAAYVRLERFSLTPNGKLDRQALPAPEGDAYVARGYEAPVGETETTLASIWAEMLGVEEVGRRDNFFELGGHSLLGMQVISQLRQTLGVEVSIRDLFAQPILASFAEYVINLQLEQFDPDKLVDMLSLMRASKVG
jgi:amino acid adenylation domain-containing protein